MPSWTGVVPDASTTDTRGGKLRRGAPTDEPSPLSLAASLAGANSMLPGGDGAESQETDPDEIPVTSHDDAKGHTLYRPGAIFHRGAVGADDRTDLRRLQKTLGNSPGLREFRDFEPLFDVVQSRRKTIRRFHRNSGCILFLNVLTT